MGWNEIPPSHAAPRAASYYVESAFSTSDLLLLDTRKHLPPCLLMQFLRHTMVSRVTEDSAALVTRCKTQVERQGELGGGCWWRHLEPWCCKMAEMRTRDEFVVAGLGWGIHNIHNISTAANCGPGQPGLLPRYILRTIPKRVLIEYMDQFCFIYLSSLLHKRKLE